MNSVIYTLQLVFSIFLDLIYGKSVRDLKDPESRVRIIMLIGAGMLILLAVGCVVLGIKMIIKKKVRKPFPCLLLLLHVA